MTWTPSEAQGPSTNPVVVRVFDNGEPSLSATNTFAIVVNEINGAPVLPALSNLIIDELTAMTVTNTATDADLPANRLTYTLLEAPAGIAISAEGVITWTPAENQGPGNFTITTRVTDDGISSLSATNTFQVTVKRS